jgi:hypothetical protein
MTTERPKESQETPQYTILREDKKSRSEQTEILFHSKITGESLSIDNFRVILRPEGYDYTLGNSDIDYYENPLPKKSHVEMIVARNGSGIGRDEDIYVIPGQLLKLGFINKYGTQYHDFRDWQCSIRSTFYGEDELYAPEYTELKKLKETKPEDFRLHMADLQIRAQINRERHNKDIKPDFFEITHDRSWIVVEWKKYTGKYDATEVYKYLAISIRDVLSMNVDVDIFQEPENFWKDWTIRK